MPLVLTRMGFASLFNSLGADLQLALLWGSLGSLSSRQPRQESQLSHLFWSNALRQHDAAICCHIIPLSHCSSLSLSDSMSPFPCHIVSSCFIHFPPSLDPPWTLPGPSLHSLLSQLDHLGELHQLHEPQLQGDQRLDLEESWLVRFWSITVGLWKWICPSITESRMFFSKNTLTSRWSKRKKHSLYVWLQAAIHLMTTPSSKNAKYCQYCGLPVIRQNHEHTENHHDHPSTSTMTAVGHYQYFT